jgi:hypothetical protein
MAFVVRLTVAKAATLMNALLTVVQLTMGLTFIVLLVYFMPNANPATVWSVIAAKLHSSYWPVILRTDSTSSKGRNPRINVISTLTLISTILLAVAGVVSPLGLSQGPLLQSGYKVTAASYVPDTSPMGQATPSRGRYTYGRICGALEPVICPGNDTGNTTRIAQSIIDTFSSTTHGPFKMQYRRFMLGTAGYNYSMVQDAFSLLQSLVLRTDLFGVEGLVVDMSSKPGVGLWNHTMPAVAKGGVWSEDLLWMEPVSSCVNTNLTLNYRLGNVSAIAGDVVITDRGGIVNLTRDYPTFDRDGQNINLYDHAYKGAVLYNFFLMQALGNVTRNQSFVGNTFPSNDLLFSAGTMKITDLGSALPSNVTITTSTDLDILCQGYGGQDTANITNVGVHCSMLLGPPQRTDGGDQRILEANSPWSQTIHVCAHVTRASVQQVTFSLKGAAELSNV